MLFDLVPTESYVWMSHGDAIDFSCNNLTSIAKTPSCTAAFSSINKHQIYGLQFHPEVAHTDHGTQILKNFARKICQGS